jgi:hypothetical protein
MGFTKHCQLSKHAWHDVVHTTTVSVTDTVGKRVARRFSRATSCPGTPSPGADVTRIGPRVLIRGLTGAAGPLQKDTKSGSAELTTQLLTISYAGHPEHGQG